MPNPVTDGAAEQLDTTKPSLVELLLKARSMGDAASADAALGALVERLYPLVERFLARRLKSYRDGADASADAAQETMIRIAAALNRCRATDDRQLVAWTLVTARRTLVDLYRSPSSGLAARALAVELQAGLDAQDEAGDTDEVTPRDTLISLALQAYATLSTDTAELLWWRLVRGAEWSEVAEHLSTTTAGAKRRFQRAQGSLQRLVGNLARDLPKPQRDEVEQLISSYVGGGSRPAEVETAIEEDAA